MKLVLLLIAAAGLVNAAPTLAHSDEQLWANGQATVKLGDKWSVSEELTGRFSDNRLTKVVTLWAGYTHDPQYTAGDLTVMERRAREQVTFDGFAKLGTGKFNARMRLEQRWREGIDGTGWRVRPYLKYSLPIAGKTALNLSSEPFFNLNTTPFQGRPGLDRMRNLITVSTPLSRVLVGEAGYMNQHGFVRSGPDTSDNIAYFNLSLSL